MKLNQQLLQINRNFLICFVVSASFSAIVAQILSDYENHLNTTITIAIGYGIFSCMFYWDNKGRYKTMKSSLIKKELFALISSFGVGEIIYLAVRWPTLYYFLEIGIEPYLASLISEIIATAGYMITVTVFLRKTKTF
jgi:hypothetical protein